MGLRSKIHVTDNGPGGLVVVTSSGAEKLVMSSQEICDDVVATIPKLHAAVQCDTYGTRWKQLRRQHGVDVFELDTARSGGCAGDEDLDLAHAVVAKVELRCHLNEVLNVLVTDDSHAYASTMQALCGASRFTHGDCVFSERRVFRAPEAVYGSTLLARDVGPTPGRVAVTLATLRPKRRLKLKTTHKRAQTLVLAAVTQQDASNNRAVHMIKTLPKAAHDALVAPADRSALRRGLDHLAVGFDIQSTHCDGSSSGSASHTTRVLAHAYASVTPASSFGAQSQQLSTASAAALARQRAAVMNPEARNVLRLLATSLRRLERVIRRRRFGFQSFIYFPTANAVSAATLLAPTGCAVCAKRFRRFRRRDCICQLCGLVVCTDCSRLHDVEARVGDVRQNRVCLRCELRVDACVFDDADLLSALGPPVIDVDDTEWYDDDAFHLAAINENDEDDEDDCSATTTTATTSLASDASVLDDVHAQLYSDDAALVAQALDVLGRLVDASGSSSNTQDTAAASYRFVDPAAEAAYHHQQQIQTHSTRRRTHDDPRVKKRDVRALVEHHVSRSLQALRDQYALSERCVIAPAERDYAFTFDAGLTRSPMQPLPPMPAPAKEAKRLQHIAASGALAPNYDRAALDLVAEVAAKRLGCPIGFISMVDTEHFYAIGAYNLPPAARKLPRTNNVCIHQVYAEQPLVLPNPQRDMRFAQLPCVQDLGVKFYAGFPVRAPDGAVVGSLCTADAVSHANISMKDYATMETLAKLAGELVAPSSVRRS